MKVFTKKSVFNPEKTFTFINLDVHPSPYTYLVNDVEKVELLLLNAPMDDDLLLHQYIIEKQDMINKGLLTDINKNL